MATIHGRGVHPRLHDRRDRGRQDHRDEVRRARRHGRVLPAAHARGSPSWAAGCTWARTTRRRTGTSSPAIVTNCTPTDAYRGAGRPEATYVVERLVDAFARKVGKDPAEVRRMNLHPPFAEATAVDHGTERRLGELRADVRPGARDRRLRPAPQGAAGAPRHAATSKQLGIGLSTYIEMCGLAPSNILGALRYAAGGWDAADDRVPARPGRCVVTDRHLAARAGARDDVGADRGRRARHHPDDIEVLHGDTAVTPLGHGHVRFAVGRGGRRGAALRRWRRSARRRGRSPRTSSRSPRRTSSGRTAPSRVKGAPDKARTIPELATSAWHAHDLPTGVEPNLEARRSSIRRTSRGRPAPTSAWSRSTRRPGRPTSCEYVAVDDCGTVINPMIVDGQVHGGVAQGIAEALYEEAIYDDPGNLMTSLDDAVPGAVGHGDPDMRARPTVTPSTTNPLGREGDRRGRDDRGAAGRRQRGGRRAVAPGRHGDREAGDARARLASIQGERAARRWRMIPAAFEYERAESVDHAIELLARRGREDPGRRPLAAAADEAAVRAGRRCWSTSGGCRGPVVRPRGRRLRWRSAR